MVFWSNLVLEGGLAVIEAILFSSEVFKKRSDDLSYLINQDQSLNVNFSVRYIDK